MTCQKIVRADELPVALTSDSWTANTNQSQLHYYLQLSCCTATEWNVEILPATWDWCAPLSEPLVRQPRQSGGGVQELSESTEFRTSQMISYNVCWAIVGKINQTWHNLVLKYLQPVRCRSMESHLAAQTSKGILLSASQKCTQFVCARVVS